MATFTIGGNTYTNTELMVTIPSAYEEQFNGATFANMSDFSRAIASAQSASEARWHKRADIAAKNEAIVKAVIKRDADVKEINTKLSLAGCWKMVNAIQNGKTEGDVRHRCYIAEQWLKANEIISNDDFDELMMTVSYWYREAKKFPHFA